MRECRYLKMCHTPYVVDFDVCYPCIGDGADTCDSYEPMVDRDALLALADKMYEYTSLRKRHGMDVDAMAARSWVRRIREACGEVRP